MRERACYACKATLYTTLHTVAQQSLMRMGMDNSKSREVTLFNGTNADDLSDPSRLGLLAALHCNVASPLARLPKAAVRAVARVAGLPNWDLAASPCLRSRLAFGVEATADTLTLVERAEEMVRSFLPLTSRDNMRVRLLHPTPLPSCLPTTSTINPTTTASDGQSPLDQPPIARTISAAANQPPTKRSSTAVQHPPTSNSSLSSQHPTLGASSAPVGALTALLEVDQHCLQRAEAQHAGIAAGMAAIGLHYRGCRAFKSGSLVPL
ncbi:hypothetical protein CLOM_g6239 [Closterium sp. NIES-68]|nr:hypothetical protein CLOM_g6239 [Closterium sp. NIES-68]